MCRHKYCHSFQDTVNPYVYAAIHEKQKTLVFLTYFSDEGRALLNVVKNESILMLNGFY